MARILIIDDDDLLRGVLAKALAHAGHEVVQACDGREGLDVCQAAIPDLVITDLVMPVLEGVETIVALHRDRPELPIIAISGGAAHSNLYLDIAGQMGATRILSKPFTPAELLTTIAEVLPRPGGARQGPASGSGT